MRLIIKLEEFSYFSSGQTKPRNTEKFTNIETFLCHDAWMIEFLIHQENNYLSG